MNTIANSHVIRFGGLSFETADPRLDDEPLSPDFFRVLVAFVADTYEGCSYHRQRLHRAGIAPADLRSFQDFERIPLLGPEDVRATPPTQLLPDRSAAAATKGGLAELPAEERITKVFQTTSSSGYPKTSFWTAHDWEGQCALMWRQHRHIPREWVTRTLNCYHAGHYGGHYIEEAFGRFGAIVMNRHFSFLSPKEVIDQLTSGLAELGGFNCLAVPPWRPPGPTKGVTLDDLINADIDNYIGRKIRVIRMGGAPTDVPGLRLRERVWEANELAGAPRTQFIEVCGGCEIGNPLTECEKGWMHAYQGAVYTEVIDEKTGRHVKTGQRGLITYTGLRQGSRFLRYLIGDEATFIAERCACGRASPRIKDIKRVTEKERLKGGCAAGGY